MPGGVAQQDGRLIPGDGLMFVNDFPLEHAGLDTAVQVLKGAPQGMVRIRVAKPLPVPDTSQLITTASEPNDEEDNSGMAGALEDEEEDNTEVRSAVSDMLTDPEALRQAPTLTAVSPRKTAVAATPKSCRNDTISSDIPDLPPPLPTSPLPEDDDNVPASLPRDGGSVLPSAMQMPPTEQLIGGTKKSAAPAPPTSALKKTAGETRSEERTAMIIDSDNIPTLPTALEQRVPIVKDADTLQAGLRILLIFGPF